MQEAHASQHSNHPALDVQGVFIDIKKTAILHDVSFRIAPGTVIGLLGPSGSGKTTLMRSIVGLQYVRDGKISVQGLLAGDRSLSRRIGYVTQSPSVYSDLTVRENVRYFARITGASKQSVEDTLDRVGLSDFAGRVVSSLSGGQRARVSLSIALVHDPDILILDEPTVGLDPVLRKQLWEHFHSLANEGKTLLVSSHVMDEAERCDRIVLLRGGRVIADDTIDNLRAKSHKERMDDIFISLINEEAQE